MAKDDLATGQWTQQYCTSHIGFCIPVHRNWWFKSFGTTTSYLWHVEVSPEELQGLGDGPLVINLAAGSIPDSDDAKIKEQGTLSWDSAPGRRIVTEITAPKEFNRQWSTSQKNLTAYEAE